MAFIGKILDEVERMIPATGANLVGVDDFEDDGERLYLIDHFPTKAAAEKAKAAKMAEPGYNGDALHVYTPAMRAR